MPVSDLAIYKLTLPGSIIHLRGFFLLFILFVWTCVSCQKMHSGGVFWLLF